MADQWTDAEDAIIRANHNLAFDVIAERVSAAGRECSARAAEARYQRLGLRRAAPPGAPWTDERLTLAHRYYVTEGKSASETAKLLGGTTRNAVIGVVNRRGWCRSEEANRASVRMAGATRRINVVTRARPSKPKVKGRGAGSSTASLIALQAPVWASKEDAGPGPKITGAVEGSLSIPISHPAFKSFGCCKWPVSDPDAAVMLFCAATAVGTYCPSHARAAYRAVPKAKRKEADVNLARLARRFA